MVKSKGTVLSLNPGIGAHLMGYQSEGFNVALALEVRDKERAFFEANHNIPVEPYDPRWIYNRKAKGTEDLIDLCGIRSVGDLDVLDITSPVANFEDTKKPQNLFDAFGIARRLHPKIVIAYGSKSVLQNKNRQQFNSFLDYLRFDNLRNPTEIKYRVLSVLFDTASIGAKVSKNLTLIVGIRKDLADRIGITTDQAIQYLLPKRRPASGLGDIDIDEEEVAFWLEQTLGNHQLYSCLREMPQATDNIVTFHPTARQKRDLGIKTKTTLKLARISPAQPLPDPTEYQLFHPRDNRFLSLSEIASAFGMPKDLKKSTSDLAARAMVSNSVPMPLTRALVRSIVLPVLNGDTQVRCAKDPILQKINLTETLIDTEAKDKTYICETDLGSEATFGLQRKEPKLKDFDYLFDANEINQDFTVLGPFDPDLGRRPVIGAVRRKVFQKEDRRRCVRAIKKVKSTTEARINCSVIPPSEKIEKWEKQGRKWELSEDKMACRVWINATKERGAHWDRWRSSDLPSSAYGWSRDKVTREITLNSELLNDKEALADFEFLNSFAETSYRKLAREDFRKQAKFLRSRVPSEYRLGGSVFTTTSVNRYGDEMPAMAYHIDTGDENSGLTTISVFDEGEYKGGYFVIPRYRCAFKVGDGDVFVANSREVHGVIRIEGAGKRLSVVSYTKTNLAYRENIGRAYPSRSPRPKFRIDQYQIAIPSYKREKTLKNRTLKFLAKHKIDPKRVTIFVANEDERETYERSLRNNPYKNLVVAAPGMVEVRKFMWSYYKEGTPVVFMDDDLQDIQMLDSAKTSIPIPDLFSDLIQIGFNAAREYNAYLWGVYPVLNPKFMSGSVNNEDYEEISEIIKVGNNFCTGQFYGTVVRHDPKLELSGKIKVKSDYEISLLHFIKDGRNVRLDFAAPKSKVYSGSGGIIEQRTVETSNLAADYLLATYPKYVRDKGVRKEGDKAGAGMREIRLV